jgi:hypothetical protein
MTFTLGSTVLPDPLEFNHPSEIIGETDYACDGTMKTDVVAVKTRFRLYWRYITSVEFASMDTLYRAVIPVDFGYPDDLGVQQTLSVRILQLDEGNRILPTLYQGVTLIMREV